MFSHVFRLLNDLNFFQHIIIIFIIFNLLNLGAVDLYLPITRKTKEQAPWETCDTSHLIPKPA